MIWSYETHFPKQLVKGLERQTDLNIGTKMNYITVGWRLATSINHSKFPTSVEGGSQRWNQVPNVSTWETEIQLGTVRVFVWAKMAASLEMDSRNGRTSSGPPSSTSSSFRKPRKAVSSSPGRPRPNCRRWRRRRRRLDGQTFLCERRTLLRKKNMSGSRMTRKIGAEARRWNEPGFLGACGKPELVKIDPVFLWISLPWAMSDLPNWAWASKAVRSPFRPFLKLISKPELMILA